MSTIYRKSGDRLFYKFVEEIGITIRVKNKQYYSQIDISYNKLIAEDALDESLTKPCTEFEFIEAHKVAIERITSQNL